MTSTTIIVYSPLFESPVKSLRKAINMDHENETDTELVAETLVEEVSIDGMCGVY